MKVTYDDAALGAVSVAVSVAVLVALLGALFGGAFDGASFAVFGAVLGAVLGAMLVAASGDVPVATLLKVWAAALCGVLGGAFGGAFGGDSGAELGATFGLVLGAVLFGAVGAVMCLPRSRIPQNDTKDKLVQAKAVFNEPSIDAFEAIADTNKGDEV